MGNWGIGPLLVNHWGGADYYKRVLALNPIAYWKLGDPTTTAKEEINAAQNGTHGAGVILNQPGIGDGSRAPNYPAVANGHTNIYTATLNGVFNGQLGALHAFIKTTTGVWADGATRVVVRISVDSNNVFQIYKYTDNTLNWNYKAGGVSKNVTNKSPEPDIVLSDDVWMSVGLSWDFGNDQFIPIYNGSLVIAPVTGLGAWGGNLAAGCIGATTTGGSSPWNGQIAHLAIFNYVPTAAQWKQLAWKFYQPFTVFFGDSIVGGTGASDAAHRWVNLVGTAKGWPTFLNAGIGGTMLQNTVQNSISTIGGAADNNGRDTVASRVVAYRPGYVCILYGFNDILLNDVAFSVANFQNDLGEVVDAIVAGGTPASNIVIGSPSYCLATYPVASPKDGGGRANHATYVAACAVVAVAKGTKYVDVFQWMADNGGDALMAGDGIHPNDAGHAAIANAFLSVL